MQDRDEFPPYILVSGYLFRLAYVVDYNAGHYKCVNGLWDGTITLEWAMQHKASEEEAALWMLRN